MSLKNVDITSALRRLADRRIEDAMKEGKFDNLQGAGKPLELEPMPAEEDARLMWWALRIMKQNDFTPDELRWRKALDYLRERLRSAENEQVLRRVVVEYNQLVHRINTMGTNAIKSELVQLSLEDEISRFRARG